MTIDFNAYFWGEKNNGFEVLYQNMKYGLVGTKELAEFFRERSSFEEVYSKHLAKLAKQAGNSSPQGTFAPMWHVLKKSSERLSALHLNMVTKCQELMKDVHKYSEELHKKHKVVKEEESGTLEVVQAIQATTVILQKAKEQYNARCSELERLKNENASQKEVEKAEAKFRKACEEYKNLVEKYNNNRQEFETKMIISCDHFQSFELSHLKQMKSFLNSYAELLEHGHELLGQVNVELRQQCGELTVENLLEDFIQAKKTGEERPAQVEFEEYPISNQSPDNLSNVSSEGANKASMNGRGLREGFLSRRKKEKKRKKDADNTSNKEEKSDGEKEDSRKSESPPLEPEVDAEGYTLKPVIDSTPVHKANSSSDSDSDDEGKKIHVEIKPLGDNHPISASVDELRAKAVELQLVHPKRPPSVDPMKRSQSQLEDGKLSHDLVGLNWQQGSNSSTPTGYAPLSSPPETNSSSNRYAELGQIFRDRDPPALPPKQNNASRGSTPTSLPRPPSRWSQNSDAVRAGRMSPISTNISRTESITSLSMSGVGVVPGSRGPSPLTIGMADTIPLAVAFQEAVNAVFRGTDESSCLVQQTGDMLLSFPVGILQVLTSNPSPAQLSFRVRNTSRLEKILPNKQIISLDATRSTEDSQVYDLHMSELTPLLRKQAERNPNSAYFYVHILKYQIKTKVGANSAPLQMVCYWKCESAHTDLRLDYKYNLHALTSPAPLLNINIAVPVDGGVTNMHSKPQGTWIADSHRALWAITELSPHGDTHGSLRARFELTNGPGSPGTVAAQFNCEGTTLSGLEFELVGSGYRLSLVKKKFQTGRYLCEEDVSRYAAPPGPPTQC